MTDAKSKMFLTPTTRSLLAFGAIFSGLAVALGAFASHGLRGQLSDRALETFTTGVRYQLYHGLALLVVGLLSQHLASRWLQGAGIAFVVGILMFSGSLYGLSLQGIPLLGILTPLGGAAFLIGWTCLAIAAIVAQPKP
ncbi:DUF423 domain-containing protein [Baaleninema simplex]|uniref:DUF423 domain-containing protein n=1 Tax=Baaleninema simplex TaxID=2862350 RepID=UPI00034B889E|nr:DUF423 domain-containing protein [Baaleninema simplex]